MAVVVIVGAQWGDEGKGGIVDNLAAQADVVARYQGGTNAGHTVINDLGTFKLHLVPSGIFEPNVTCIIGSGVVVNPCELIDELDQLIAQGVSVDRFFVSDRAHVVLPYHPVLDTLEEERLGPASIGTTRRGIGPAYTDKVARVGLRMCDLIEPTGLRDQIYGAVERKNILIEELYGGEGLDPEAIYEQYRAHGQRLAPRIADTSALLQTAIRAGKNVLLEGAQATLLDLDHGTYPFVTSSSPTAGGASIGLGIGPTQITRVMGVFKAYQTRVGAGPFPTEALGEDGDTIRTLGYEYGTTTGRPRRCGWFDAVAGRYAVRVNGMQSAAVTKLDVLDGHATIPVCVGYRLDGKIVDTVPASLTTYARCEPLWEQLPGWQASTSEARTFAELPGAAQAFLDRISELIDCPIDLVSVGSHRRQTIIVNPIFR
jgi:adenylosuccinate synthase